MGLIVFYFSMQLYVVVFSSNSNIMILDYNIANEQLICFKMPKSKIGKQVSQDYRNLNPLW